MGKGKLATISIRTILIEAIMREKVEWGGCCHVTKKARDT